MNEDPIPMLLWCPDCFTRHIDEGEFATKPHHTHACQGCGLVWRPAVVSTVGVQFLPGLKSENLEDRRLRLREGAAVRADLGVNYLTRCDEAGRHLRVRVIRYERVGYTREGPNG